jgi:hypothetical protein
MAFLSKLNPLYSHWPWHRVFICRGMRQAWLTLIFLMPLWLSATPAQVLILRHAEKRTDQDPHLSERGWARARALPGFFAHRRRAAQYGRPVALYAMAPHRAGASVRAIETLEPLSQQLGLSLHRDFTRNQTRPLVREIMNDPNYDGRTVVIAWGHDQIPELATLFGAHDAPSEWDADVYDRVWAIEFINGEVSSFNSVKQRLLPGDSE